MKITQEVRAYAMEQAGRRCECTGSKCRHHLRGARCKRGLRGDQWKVFWRKEDGGVNRENIEAWCLECFDNNFDVPRERVALLAMDIVAFGSLLDEDRRRALTLKSVLRDAAERAAGSHRGRIVFERLDDDVLLEFPAPPDAVDAALSARSSFRDLAGRLNLDAPAICGALHCGEVTRWRNGLLVGDAVDTTLTVRSLAGTGQIVITGSAVEPLRGGLSLAPLAQQAEETSEKPPEELWALQLPD